MSLFTVVVILIVALPLILVCLGFFMLVVSLSQNRSHSSALQLAQDLQKTLARMEERIETLEDILISVKPKEGGSQ